MGSWFHALLPGLWITLEVSGATMAITVVASILLAIASISPSAVARRAATVYVDVFRSIPLLALLIFTYYGLGRAAVTLHVPALWLGIFGLSLSESAYLGEIYRSALRAVPGTQWEAGRSLGLAWGQIVRSVIFPQFVLPAIPSTLVMMVAVVKNSSLLSIIAISELTLTAENLIAQTFKPLQIYLLLAAIYLAITLPLGYLARFLEGRFDVGPTGSRVAVPGRRTRLASPVRAAHSMADTEHGGRS